MLDPLTNIAYLGLNWYQLQQKFEGWVKKCSKVQLNLKMPPKSKSYTIENLTSFIQSHRNHRKAP